jgi:uncharacterized protein (DUF2132 family)
MDPLHGITLEQMIVELVDELGWEHMGYLVPINCFKNDPKCMCYAESNIFLAKKMFFRYQNGANRRQLKE